MHRVKCSVKIIMQWNFCVFFLACVTAACVYLSLCSFSASLIFSSSSSSSSTSVCVVLKWTHSLFNKLPLLFFYFFFVFFIHVVVRHTHPPLILFFYPLSAKLIWLHAFIWNYLSHHTFHLTIYSWHRVLLHYSLHAIYKLLLQSENWINVHATFFSFVLCVPWLFCFCDALSCFNLFKCSCYFTSFTK